jgi:23S rRNA (cytosine1962-C5)-methyltransferase
VGDVINPAIISARGVGRWTRGHPWVFRSDVVKPPDAPAGVVPVQEASGRELGWALWSPRSEISLRLLDRNPGAHIDTDWWRDRFATSAARRSALNGVTNAYRVVHGEADGCPSLICDRYDRWLVVQLLSAGLESCREDIVTALEEVLRPEGIVARNDPPVRSREGLERETTLLRGEVPKEIEVVENGIRYLAAPWEGQKTGAFLDQRENRLVAGEIARGRALDCFSYHGSFALHLARGAEHVDALDASGVALERGRENALRNGFENINFLEADAFVFLRDAERQRTRYETIVLDPPAFAKSRAALPGAIRGYNEINLRAMRLLSPGGMLLTASCSFHLTKSLFLEMLQSAAADSGRRIAIRRILAQPLDHPEILSIPETGYIKGAVLEAVD